MRQGTPITWEQVRVGLFIMTGLVMMGTLIFLVGGTGYVFGKRYQLVTLLNSAAGLVPGAAVQLAGQNVGQVERIRFIAPGLRPETGEPIAVWMAINEDVRDQIRTDSRAQVRTRGLLGDRVIDIRPGTAEARVLEPSDTVPATSSLDYDQVLAEGAAAISDLVTVTGNLAVLTANVLRGDGTLGQLVTDDRLYESLVSLSVRLDTLAAIAASPESSVGRLIRDEELYFGIRSAVESFDSVAASLARGEGSIGKLIRSDSLYVDLRSVVQRTDSLLALLQSGDGAAGKLLTNDELYEEILRTVVELNAVLADLRSDPSRYVPEVSIF